MDIQKTIKNLQLRGYKVSHFSTAQEAADYMQQNIQGCTVGIGGSKTAQQLDLYQKLSQQNTVYWHWITPGAETIARANDAQVYISGVNAMTEDGEILNIDGRGNRLAGQVYGNKKVYFIAGTNKLCPDFHSALYRARNVAAVENCKRFENNNPCKIDDKCHDCRMDTRICRALLVMWGPMMGMEAEVILIDQDLGM